MRRPGSLATVLFSLGCGATGGPGAPADTGPAATDAGLPPTDTPAPADSPPVEACVSSVPCTTDLQCVALPGHGCNLGLAFPRCQRLECGEPGTPCAPATIGGRFGNGAEQGLCAMRSCRHVEPGPWTCRVDPLTQAECVAVCAGSRQNSGCGADVCDAACSRALGECAMHQGLSDIHYGSICSAPGVRTCGDGTLVRR